MIPFNMIPDIFQSFYGIQRRKMKCGGDEFASLRQCERWEFFYIGFVSEGESEAPERNRSCDDARQASKRGVKVKYRLAGWDDDYLLTILTQKIQG